MNSIEVARKVLADGVQVFRKDRMLLNGYEVKSYWAGNKRGWTILDSFSASAIIAVFDGLNAENKAKFAALPLEKAARVAFTLLK